MGALYGLGLFETLRVYNGHPFALGRHINRLAKAARGLGLAAALGGGAPAIAAAVGEVLDANALADAAVRITLTATGTDWDNLAPSLAITARPFAGYPAQWYEHGIDLVIAPWRRCPEDMHVTIKSPNYLTCIAARKFARDRGAHEALLLNSHGRIAEGAVSNVFIVSDGELVTPPVSEGLLPGVTRAIVMEIAQDLSLPVRERPLSAPELTAASEVFVTNSLMEVTPVRSVEGVRTARAPGDVTLRLMHAYRQRVEEAAASSNTSDTPEGDATD